MEQKLVSIIIPTYKGSDNICRAVDSVLSQGYKNIEIIVVDDNGIGTQEQVATASVIKKYENDSRVNYICHEVNKNGSIARNTGIRAAHGDYIALLDDDDIFFPNKLELQYEVLASSEEEVGLCYTAFEIIFPDGRVKREDAILEDDICFEALCGKVQIPSSTMMFKKSAWEEIGGFDESFIRHQDWEYLVRMSNEFKVKAINVICMRRVILKRNSPKNADKFKDLRIYYLEKMSPIINKFSSKQQKYILFVHYNSISKEYLKEKNYYNAINYAIKSGKPFLVLKKLIKDGSTYVYSKYKRSSKKNSVI